MRLLGISGSLRKQSTNSKLLLAATDQMPAQASFKITDCIDKLPFFNPDIAPESSAAALKWIDEVRQSDALIVSTPEYARGYPGVLKNALDWLVQTDAFIDKPFMFLHGSNRSSVAKDTLATVLETMSGIHVEEASLTIHLVGSTLSLEDLSVQYGDQIHASLKVLVDHLAVSSSS